MPETKAIILEIRRCWLCLCTYFYDPASDDPDEPQLCPCGAAWKKSGLPVG